MASRSDLSIDEVAKQISVIVPTYNRPEKTRRAIRSVFDQSVNVGEIIIVDDASTDAFHLDEFENRPEQFNFLRLERNSGAGAARQAGVDAASGDYIAFLDSDDVWLPQKLAAQIPTLPDPEEMIGVVCGWQAQNETSGTVVERTPIESSSVKDFASACWFAPGSTAILPRKAFEHVGPFDPKLRRLEDLDWFLRFALKGGSIRVSRVIGANIEIGHSANSTAVIDAADYLEGKFETILDRDVNDCLKAYLEIERALAARNDGQPRKMLGHILKSWALAPRMRLHLKDWWS
ncbi:MAG: glycosyltransferase family 2 protein [Pseudomonadota bacterium]